MSAMSLRERACRALNSDPRIALPLALVFGLLVTGHVVSNLQAGESLRQQAWFVGFLVAYGVGMQSLIAQIRE
jgi:hypothetical protein